jgi:hypothetical protein
VRRHRRDRGVIVKGEGRLRCAGSAIMPVATVLELSEQAEQARPAVR